jgi:hypothetical protein
VQRTEGYGTAFGSTLRGLSLRGLLVHDQYEVMYAEFMCKFFLPHESIAHRLQRLQPQIPHWYK